MNILNYANLNAHKERPFTPHGKHLTLWNTSDSFCIVVLKAKAADSARKAEHALCVIMVLEKGLRC